MFTCPSCNGSLRFDIASQKLKCEHCGNTYQIDEYKLDNNAEEGDFFGAQVYTCSNCGAELISPDESIVAFCSYCGSEQVIQGRMIKEKKPQRIIPFRVTKEITKESFQKMTKRVAYVPKEYKDPQFLEKFRGIYIPYWTYDVSFNDSVPLTGIKRYRRGDYVYEEEYEVQADLKGLYGGIPYDASSSFDDSLADELAPYHSKAVKTFQTPYLAGFYADRADVPADAYNDAVKERAGNQAIDIIRRKFEKQNQITLDFPIDQEAQNKLLGTKIESQHATLFPVWFLTWRKKDRVAYAVANGETGKIAADIPVATGKYFFGTAVLAIGLFVLFNMVISMTAPTALTLSSAVAVVTAGLFEHQIRDLHDREMHIFDMGWFLTDRETKITLAKAKKLRRRREKGAPDFLYQVLIIGICATIFCLIPVCIALITTILDISPIRRATVGTIILMVPAAYYFIRSLFYLKNINEKTTSLQALSCFIASSAAFVICWMKPVADWWYYLGCVICLAAVLITCLGLIQRYNEYATRDIPAYHQRKGGDDSEKD